MNRKHVNILIKTNKPAKEFGLVKVKKYFFSEHDILLAFVVLDHELVNFMSDNDVFLTRMDIYSSELINAEDLHAISEGRLAVKKNKINGSIHRGAIKVVEKEDVHTGANILSSRCVLTIKTDRGYEK